MAEFKYEIVEKLGVISQGKGGWERQLNLVSWSDREPKYDIRDWSADGTKMGKGISMTAEELAVLKEILDEISTDDIYEQVKDDKKYANSFLYSIVMDKENTGAYVDMPVNQKRFISQVEMIKKLVKDGPCVLVGLCADYALADRDNVISFYIHADINSRIRRIARIYDVTDSKALDMINETDAKRNNYYNFYTTKNWGQADSYTMCLDSSILGIEGTAEMIEQLVRLKDNHSKRKLQ